MTNKLPFTCGLEKPTFLDPSKKNKKTSEKVW